MVVAFLYFHISYISRRLALQDFCLGKPQQFHLGNVCMQRGGQPQLLLVRGQYCLVLVLVVAVLVDLPS